MRQKRQRGPAPTAHRPDKKARTARKLCCNSGKQTGKARYAASKARKMARHSSARVRMERAL